MTSKETAQAEKPLLFIGGTADGERMVQVNEYVKIPKPNFRSIDEEASMPRAEMPKIPEYSTYERMKIAAGEQVFCVMKECSLSPEEVIARLILNYSV